MSMGASPCRVRVLSRSLGGRDTVCYIKFTPCAATVSPCPCIASTTACAELMCVSDWRAQPLGSALTEFQR